ncbi:hypothetical protein BDP27DRAFT_1326161 [Rhodocollybia butyracea]|uniref:F-box domain-containing protein n=1 Tax=Rhodocollybia butyracea TaxID=206335 RepID=A0A9P5PT63_9AGAR|nr:hypothetical protein BDP27DRAFT_1326161 [Rhodocollybia butyracea]
MAELLDLPEELLSIICSLTEQGSLIPLALSCKIFNRIAGNHYLQRLGRFGGHYLYVSALPRYGTEVSFKELQNIASILGSLTNVYHLDCQFSASSTVKELRFLASIIRPIQRMNTVKLRFNNPGRCLTSAFHKAFEGLLQEAQGLGYRQLDIQGIVPPVKGSFKYNLPPYGRLSSFTVSDGFLRTLPHRKWIISLLNSSPAVSCLILECSQEWTEILPKLCIPSLQTLSFMRANYGGLFRDQSRGKASDISVLADFASRHKNLDYVDCSGQFAVTTTSSKTQHPLPHIKTFKGTLPQLYHLISGPDGKDILCNLQIIHIVPYVDVGFEVTPPGPLAKKQLSDLFALIHTRSTIRKLVISAKSLPTLNSRKPKPSLTKFTFQHLLELEINDFGTLSETSIAGFVRWGRVVYPSAHALHMQNGHWKPERASLFAQAVIAEWPSVQVLELDWTSRNIAEWIKCPCSRYDQKWLGPSDCVIC